MKKKKHKQRKSSKKSKKEESSCDEEEESSEDEKPKTKTNKQKNSNYLPQKQFKVSLEKNQSNFSSSRANITS